MEETQNYLVEETPETEITENQTEESSSDNKLVELEAQKRHWREKAQKESETRRKLEEELTKLRGQTPAGPNQYATRDELTDIKLGNMGLDVELASFVKTYAKGAGKEPLEVLEDPAVKSFIDKKRQDKELANAIPEPSSRTISFGGKTLTEMSREEKLQALKELGSEAARKIKR
jgi:hypothetical protein